MALLNGPTFAQAIDDPDSELAKLEGSTKDDGLLVDLDARPFVHADHFFRHNDGAIRNSRGAFFAGGRAGEDAALKIEDDHRLVWLDPHEAVVRLDRESHAWAVAAWLRLRARA